ncbi:MAG: hypothetical protein NTZ33_08225 [Bacteroidetes bacterium]|nr:hypothetical protein [Bacteroidota bacterium]
MKKSFSVFTFTLLFCCIILNTNCKKESSTPNTTKNTTLTPDTCDIFIGNYMFTDSSFNVNNSTVFEGVKTYPISVVKDNSKVAGIFIYNLYTNGLISLGDIHDSVCSFEGSLSQPVFINGDGSVSGNKFSLYYTISANPFAVYSINRGTAIRY